MRRPVLHAVILALAALALGLALAPRGGGASAERRGTSTEPPSQLPPHPAVAPAHEIATARPVTPEGSSADSSRERRRREPRDVGPSSDATTPSAAPAVSDPHAAAGASGDEDLPSLFSRDPRLPTWPPAEAATVRTGDGPTSLAGVVVEDDSDAPVAGAAVRLAGSAVAGYYNLASLTTPVATTLTDELGRFRFTGLPARGAVVIEAAAPPPSTATARESRSLESHERVTVLRIRAPQGEVEARAVNAEGDPIDGANVSAVRSFPSFEHGYGGSSSVFHDPERDEDGWWRFRVAPGPLLVRGYAEGYDPTSTAVVVASGERMRIEVRLRPTVTRASELRVRVVDEGGSPLEARVLWRTEHADWSVAKPEATGVYAAQILAGPVTIRAEAAGRTPTVAALLLEEDATTDMTLALAPRRDWIEGRVLDAFDRPIADVRVGLATLDHNGTPIAHATSGVDGRFRFEGIPAGGAWVYAPEEAAHIAGEAVAWDLASELVLRRKVRVRVRLGPGSTWSGTPWLYALDHKGELDAWGADQKERPETVFRIGRAPPGALILRDHPSPPLTIPALSAPRPGEAIDLEVELPAAAILRGRLLDGAGAPRRRAVVRATLPGDLAEPQRRCYSWSALAEALTDAEGRFTLGGLPSRIALFVEGDGLPARRLDLTDLTPGAITERDLRLP